MDPEDDVSLLELAEFYDAEFEVASAENESELTETEPESKKPRLDKVSLIRELKQARDKALGPKIFDNTCRITFKDEIHADLPEFEIDLEIDRQLHEIRENTFRFIDSRLELIAEDEVIFARSWALSSFVAVFNQGTRFLLWAVCLSKQVTFESLAELTAQEIFDLMERFRNYLITDYRIYTSGVVRTERNSYNKVSDGNDKLACSSIQILVYGTCRLLRLFRIIDDACYRSLTSSKEDDRFAATYKSVYEKLTDFCCVLGPSEILCAIEADKTEMFGIGDSVISLANLGWYSFLGICCASGVRPSELAGSKRHKIKPVLLNALTIKKNENDGHLILEIVTHHSKYARNANYTRTIKVHEENAEFCPVKYLILFLGLRGIFEPNFAESVSSGIYRIKAEFLNDPIFCGTMHNMTITNKCHSTPARTSHDLISKLLRVPNHIFTAASTRKYFAHMAAFRLLRHSPVAYKDLFQELTSSPNWKSSACLAYLKSFHSDVEEICRVYQNDVLAGTASDPEDYFIPVSDIVKHSTIPTMEKINEDFSRIEKIDLAKNKESNQQMRQKIREQIDLIELIPDRNVFTELRLDQKRHLLAKLTDNTKKAARARSHRKDKFVGRYYARFFKKAKKIAKSATRTFKKKETAFRTIDLETIAANAFNTSCPNYNHKCSAFCFDIYDKPDNALCVADGCSEIMESDAEFYKHFNASHMGSSFKCRFCGDTISTVKVGREEVWARIRNHFVTKHVMYFVCPKCKSGKSKQQVKTTKFGNFCRICKTQAVIKRGLCVLSYKEVSTEFCGCQLGKCVSELPIMQKLLDFGLLHSLASIWYPNLLQENVTDAIKQVFTELLEKQTGSPINTCALSKLYLLTRPYRAEDVI